MQNSTNTTKEGQTYRWNADTLVRQYTLPDQTTRGYLEHSQAISFEPTFESSQDDQNIGFADAPVRL